MLFLFPYVVDIALFCFVFISQNLRQLNWQFRERWCLWGDWIHPCRIFPLASNPGCHLLGTAIFLPGQNIWEQSYCCSDMGFLTSYFINAFLSIFFKYLLLYQLGAICFGSMLQGFSHHYLYQLLCPDDHICLSGDNKSLFYLLSWFMIGLL